MANSNANPILISNQALQQPQSVTESFKESTGTIIYANGFSGVGRVPMPEAWREALNSDYGETGNNVVIQLQQKIQQMPDGPWYVDTRDGVLYIHNRKLQEPSRASYTYQGGNGELLQVSFETQYVTKTQRASTATGIDPNKGLNTEVVSNGQQSVRMVDQQTYYEYYDPITKRYSTHAIINAFKNRQVSFGTIMAFSDRYKQEMGGGKKTPFTAGQWKTIHDTHNKQIVEDRKKQKAYTDKKYQEYQATDRGTGGVRAEGIYREQAVQETLETKDLEANVLEFLTATYGTGAPKVMAELDQAAKSGTLEAILKNRYQGIAYTFNNRKRNDGGAVVEAWTTTKMGPGPRRVGYNQKAIDDNPNVHRISGMGNDGYATVFTKTAVAATISGYRLLRAYYTRKYGSIDQDLSRRVLASVNQSRKYTEKKLQAKAIVIGRPSLATSQVITFNNVGKRWSGAWYIKKCLHKIEGSSGYTTELELTRHRGVEGYSASTEKNTHGHDTSQRSLGGSTSSKPLTSINLTSLEANFWNASKETNKEDLAILKLAGVKDAVVPKGRVVGDLTKTQKVNFVLVRRPTAEERKKYGRQAQAAIQSGKKATKKK
jgi:hypothetical protein